MNNIKDLTLKPTLIEKATEKLKGITLFIAVSFFVLGVLNQLNDGKAQLEQEKIIMSQR